jgi:hypothetical protein
VGDLAADQLPVEGGQAVGIGQTRTTARSVAIPDMTTAYPATPRGEPAVVRNHASTSLRA